MAPMFWIRLPGQKEEEVQALQHSLSAVHFTNQDGSPSPMIWADLEEHPSGLEASAA